MMDVIATGECWAKSSQGQGCQTFSRPIINITNYTDEELENDGDDDEYIQGWRERALKAQAGPIPKIGSRLLISSSYIQQDFSWHLYLYLCGHSLCALIKCTASPTYILYDYDKKDPLNKFEL